MSKEAFNFIPVVRGTNRLTVVNAADADAELVLIGAIGKSWYDDSGITEKEVRDALKTVPAGKRINARINSEGGSVKEGLGIYNAFKERRQDITAHITGYALSIASVFPLGAGKVVSPKSAIWMMHKAWAWNQGNADDMRQAAEMLDAHDETLVDIYAAETGKSASEIRSAMESETWIKGSDAVAFGLADESGDPETDDASAAYRPLAADYVSRCKNISPEILNAIRLGPAAGNTAAPGGGQQTTPQPQEHTMNKKLIVALLKKHGIEALETETDEQLQTKLDQLPLAAAPAPQPQPAPTAPAAGVTAEEFRAEKRRRIRAEVLRVGENKIPNDKIDVWTDRAMAGDESAVLAEISGLNAANVGGEGLGFNRIDSVIDGVDFGVLKGSKSPELVNIHKEHKSVNARYRAKISNWKNLLDLACQRDESSGREVFAANTYSATLVTSFLMDGSVTDLQNVWAPLKAFTLDSSPDPYKPLATGVLKHVTAGAATQTDATDFESGNSTVAPVSITMHQYSQSFHISNIDLNSGARMEDLVKINTANFSNKVIEVATVPITVAIFTGATVTSAAAAFGFSDLAELQGLLKKSPIKNLILDGTYIARIANSPGFFQQTGLVGGNPGAWRAFGWDMIAQNTNWTGAGANVVGFACNPQAIAGITGLPLTPPNIPGGIFAHSTATVPGLEIPYMVSSWFNPKTRTMWSGFDIMAGFKEVDITAGFILKSA